MFLENDLSDLISSFYIDRNVRMIEQQNLDFPTIVCVNDSCSNINALRSPAGPWAPVGRPGPSREAQNRSRRAPGQKSLLLY